MATSENGSHDMYSAGVAAPPGGPPGSRRDLVPIGPAPNYYPIASWQGGVPAQPELLTASPDPLSLLHAFRRRWLLATSLGMVLGGTAMVLAWIFVPVQDEVKAFVRILAAPPSLLDANTRMDLTEFKTYRSTQAQLIKSRPTLTAALRDTTKGIPQLAIVREQDDPVDWLSSELVLEYPDDAELLVISMSSDRPDQAAKVVNAVVDAYFEGTVDREKSLRQKQLASLQTEYRKYEKNIAEKSSAMEKAAKDVGAHDQLNANARLSTENQKLNSISSMIAGLETQIRTTDEKILDAEYQLELAQSGAAMMFEIEQKISSDSRLNALQEAYDLTQEHLTMAQGSAKDPNARSLQRLQGQLQGLQQKIDERRSELEEKYQDISLQSLTPKLEGELEKQKKFKEKLEADLKTNREAQAAQMDIIKQMGGSSALIENMKAEIERYDIVIREISQNMQKMQIDIGTEDRVQRIENAVSDDSMNAGRKYLFVAFAGMAGFGLAALGVSFREFLARRISSSTQLANGLGMRVVGALPSVSRSRGRPALVQGMLVESIDSVRANLMHRPGETPTKVVLITSALDREGKTTVATQLAASLARAGRRTILVDADLRRPSAHRMFDMPLDPGLSEVLREQAELEDVVQPTRAEGLWLIPAGQYDLEAIQALAKEDIGRIFDQLRNRFDFVVVDSAPVLTIADSLMLGQHVDAAIISVMRDVSQAPKVYDACERLQTLGVHVLGAVINGEKSSATYRAYAAAR